ncbi:uncharacterized protein LOC123397668 [Hordeum vulgare subsp. vulgare]|uniref:uncharacterized protein LOC123397668 n=1 Tax=Hordeum vulgare subsp. vulgare TaxID=112509 RepID=UPI001D1A3EED|nr:uncharacterized protein LOC123397668 [Hordeum vulgare subsp. vulgare]
MSKNEAQKQRLTLNREQYMMVIPKWCLGKGDGWARLVDRWLGDDAEFAAKSSRARANRGKDGTHGQGNRNHWGFKAMKVYLYAWFIFVLLFIVTVMFSMYG